MTKIDTKLPNLKINASKPTINSKLFCNVIENSYVTDLELQPCKNFRRPIESDSSFDSASINKIVKNGVKKSTKKLLLIVFFWGGEGEGEGEGLRVVLF